MARKTVSGRFAGLGVGVGAAVIVVLAASPTAAQTTVRVCDGVEATIVGTPGDDRLVGTAGPDVISGLQGDDQIFGLGGDDIICAGFGDDIVFGGEGFDVIFGAQGNDVLLAANGPGEAVRQDSSGSRMFGGAGNDQLIGSNRWDRMQGGEGADLLMGYEGRDWIRGGGSADQVDGGRGIDDIHTGWGPDRIDVGFGDDIRAGLGVDHCNIDGRAERLWSCETQIPIEQVDFDQQVDGGYFEHIGRGLMPPEGFDVFPARTFDVDGTQVSTFTNLESLPEQASVVAFYGTLRDNGRGGPEACLNGTLDSFPVQCGGPIIDGLEFHPSWTTHHSTTRVGQRPVHFTWPPIDGHVTLIEELTDVGFGGIDLGDDFDPDAPLFPLPQECADIETFVDSDTLHVWELENPDKAAGIFIADSRFPVIQVVGDAEPVRTDLRTDSAEACVVGGIEFSNAEIQQTRDELTDVLIGGGSGVLWSGIGSSVLENRVRVSVPIVDQVTISTLRSFVSRPEMLRIETGGQLFVIE